MRVRVTSLGLFLAVFAAFALAAGSPAVAAGETTVIEKTFASDAGKTALEKAGISAEQFSEMVGKLTSEQRAKVEGMLTGMTPEARLSTRLLAAGYTEVEVAARIATLSSDEVAKLAASDQATSSAGGVGTVIFIAALLIVALVIALYFMALEEPYDETPRAMPVEPAPMAP